MMRARRSRFRFVLRSVLGLAALIAILASSASGQSATSPATPAPAFVIAPSGDTGGDLIPSGKQG